MELGPRSYDVLIGSDIATDVAEWLPAEKPAPAWLVTHPSLAPIGAGIAAALTAAGWSAQVLEVPEGERSKSFECAAGLCAELASRHARRTDLLVGVGGGVIGDLAGFVASIYQRGMRLVQVPTTLLAQVDSSVGGKTALNLAVAKNVIGTIHQPSAVVSDVALLGSLPDAEVTSGLAEVIKYGLIADPSLLTVVRERAGDLRNRDTTLLEDLVESCVRVKAGVVSRDETDAGERAVLNYGHTFGHAIEITTGMRHGEAVALGMMAAAYLAEEMEMIDSAHVERHREALSAVGLPVAAPLDVGDLERAWSLDKKYSDGVRFVLLSGEARPVWGVEAPRDRIVRAIERLSR